MSLEPYVRARSSTPRRGSAPRTHKIYPFQAPMKGLDTSAALPAGDPLTALRLENLIPRSFGVTLRRGFSRWCSNMGSQVRTLVEFQPAVGDWAMFAAADNGTVYDITGQLPSSATPPAAFSDLNAEIDGEYSWLNFTSDTGTHFLVMVGKGVGIRTYNGVTPWLNITEGTGPMQIEGIDPKKLSHVMLFKRRLWFIEADSTSAWYLPTGQVAGLAKEFDFSALFPHGGYLAGLTNWTVDSGEGIDDKLVVIGSNGDVLIYKGIDPAQANSFQLEGRWYIGRVPVGHRFFTQFLTDVAVLSERGMCFLSELLRGDGLFANATVTKRINGDLAELVVMLLQQRYWEVKFLPAEQLIVINVPTMPSGKRAYAYEVNGPAFCVLTNMPMHTIDQLNGRTFFGDSDGNVWLAFEGNTDGSVDGEPGADLEGRAVSAFMPMGEAVRVKRWLMVRPSFIARSAPSFRARLNGDWVFALPSAAPSVLKTGESLWDSGVWDTAVWSGETNSYESWVGCEGTGRYAALALQIRGPADTVFVGWQALVSEGGIL